LPPDGAVDVDLARAAGDGRQHGRVEVAPGRLGDSQLEDAVDGVGGDPAAEDAERPPEVLLAASRDERDGREQEQEVEHELDHPFGPLGERSGRLEVEEAEQVDGEEGEEERERDRGRAGEAACRAARAG
jgi:hypothetical protein